MKNILVLFFLFGLSVHLLAQTEQHINADIQHVTVFLDKAQIDATARTSVNAGTSKIVIENLATTIDPNSIQVGGKGDVVIMGVKFQQNYLKRRAAMAIEDSLKQAKNELETLEMLVKVAENERTMVMANANFKTEKEGVSPENLKEMADVFRTKLTEIGTRQLQLQRQVRDTQARIQRLEQHLNDQNINRNQPTGEIILTVSSKTATNLELTLSYVVSNAGWSPTYDLRATSIKNPIALAYRANVYQNTGADWKNVRLTLSTANPTLGNDKPNIGTQFVSIYEMLKPVPVAMAMQSRVAGVQVMNDDKFTFGEEAKLKNMATAASVVTVTESQFAANFEISVPYTIASGGSSPEVVDIQAYNLPAEFSYSATPKLDKDGFLVARILDWEKYNLLPGTANVYFEGTYVGNSQIATGTTDSLMISLGRDKKIATKREILEDFKSRKAVGSNVKENFGYRISLRNTKSEAVTLTVEDQIPVSQDSRIEVELLEATGGELNRETGKITWKVNLEPNTGKDLILKYSVKYPKGKTVSNL